MNLRSTILSPLQVLTDAHRWTTDPDAVLSAAAGVALEALALWMTVVLLAGVLGAVPGAVGRRARGLARAVTPVLLQRVVAAVVGVAGVAAPATAWAASAPVSLDLPAPGQPAGDVTSRPAAAVPTPVVAVSSPATAAPAPPAPPAPSAAPAPATAPTSPAAAPPTPPARGSVIVRPGDTLWGLARAALPGGASDSAVAAAWPQWWALNHGVIGSDPGLLLPGQQLQVPGGAA